MLARTIDAAERGWLPDPVIRAGIHWLLRSRLSGERRDPDAIRRSQQRFVEELRHSPIAQAVDSANEQHTRSPPTSSAWSSAPTASIRAACFSTA